MTTHNPQTEAQRLAKIAFVGWFLLLIIFLLIQLPYQTRWLSGKALVSQPAFWSIVSLATMMTFALLFLILHTKDIRQHLPKILTVSLQKELISVFEFCAWFLVYVYAVPYLGYLIGTVCFMLLLAVRMDYRSKKMLYLAAITAVVIVIFFKSIMQVKIPGGEIYHLFPEQLGIFLILYL